MKDVIAQYLGLFFGGLGRFFLLFHETLRWTFRRPFDRKALVAQMVQTGINSLPIVLITALFTGMVMSLQTAFAIETKIKGAAAFMGSVVGLAMVRELGPVLTAVFVSGRVGSSIAAELGSMKITDQIDALETLSTSPVQYLVVPRFLALVIVLPILTVFADLVGMVGGAFVTYFSLGVPLQTYVEALGRSVHASDILSGLIKTVFFGAIISLVASIQGLRTTGGAEGVGQATTKAVVVASIAVLVSDYFLTILLKYMFNI